MDPFIDYPPELLQEICNKLDDVSLVRAAKASSTIYQACFNILRRRKEHQQQMFYDFIKTYETTYFIKYFYQYNLVSNVRVWNDDKTINVTQYERWITDPYPDKSAYETLDIRANESKNIYAIIPWVLTDIQPEIGDLDRAAEIPLTDDNIHNIVRDLMNKGYSFEGTKL